MDGHLVFSDKDLIGNVFNDFAFFLGFELRPAGIEVPGLSEDFILGKVLDLEEINLSEKPRELVVELLETFFQRTVLTTKSLGGDLIPHEEAVDLVHFLLDLLLLRLQGREKLLLHLDGRIGLFQIAQDLRGREVKVFERLLEDGLEIGNRHLVSALVADVLRRV
ncbi:MAG TPA: hypothetical protein VLK65_21670 [Vicinamibacteria bacterium]|nr:hypothetical protein [Vicinamibacteria bacterium]